MQPRLEPPQGAVYRSPRREPGDDGTEKASPRRRAAYISLIRSFPGLRVPTRTGRRDACTTGDALLPKPTQVYRLPAEARSPFFLPFPRLTPGATIYRPRAGARRIALRDSPGIGNGLFLAGKKTGSRQPKPARSSTARLPVWLVRWRVVAGSTSQRQNQCCCRRGPYRSTSLDTGTDPYSSGQALVT